MSICEIALESLQRARIQLLIKFPFVGNLACRFPLVQNNDWCKTAATDGRTFYYNSDFVKSLSPSELLFLVGHETYHAILMHGIRRGGRDPELWNMAADYLVNAILEEGDGKGNSVGTVISGALLDTRYTVDMSTEEIYNDLNARSVKIQMPLDQHISPDGSSSGRNEGEDAGSSPNGTATVRVFGEDGPPVLTQEEMDQIEEDMRQAMVQAAQAVGAGNVPAAMKRLISELTEAKRDWRNEISATIKSINKNDYTMQRIGRRSFSVSSAFGRDMIFPGNIEEEKPEVAIAIDTSGSMSEHMIRDLLSEVNGMMEQFTDYILHVWFFDTECGGYVKFTPENREDINTIEIYGGGGTMFMPNWDFMKENKIMPDRFLMFTDGGCWDDEWGDPLYCDTLFLIHSNPGCVAPFGETSYYEFTESN